MAVHNEQAVLRKSYFHQHSSTPLLLPDQPQRENKLFQEVIMRVLRITLALLAMVVILSATASAQIGFWTCTNADTYIASAVLGPD